MTSVSDFVTSYRLKTVFLHLVEMFLQSDLSHGKMVLMVYEYLEKCLERKRLPSFADPSVNVLAGSKLSRVDSLKVVKAMTRLVRAMYEEGFQSEKAADERNERMLLQAETRRCAELMLRSGYYRLCLIPIYLKREDIEEFQRISEERGTVDSGNQVRNGQPSGVRRCRIL